MKLHCYLIGAEVLQTLRQLDFLLVKLQIDLRLGCLGDLLAGNRTEGLAALTDFDGNGDGLLSDISCQGSGLLQDLLAF